MSDLQVTDETFEAEVIQAELPVLVDFWADWCAPCHLLAPILKEIAAEYVGRLKVVKFDVNGQPRMAVLLGIRSIPTLILFKDGQPVKRLVGAMPKGKLLDEIVPHLSNEASPML